MNPANVRLALVLAVLVGIGYLAAGLPGVFVAVIAFIAWPVTTRR